VSTETKGDTIGVGVFGISYAYHCRDPYQHSIVDRLIVEEVDILKKDKL